MAPFRTPLTLGRKFALIFGLLVLLLASVCGVVLHHVGSMRADAETLMEETEETAQGNTLKLHIAELQMILRFARQQQGFAPEDLQQMARTALARSRQLLDTVVLEQEHHLEQVPEHQALEQTLFKEIRAGLDTLAQDLERSATPTVPPETLARAFACAQQLEQANREETARAQQDVQEHARSALWVMAATVLLSVLALCGALWFVVAQVVRPVLALRQGTERFGRGDLQHRIHSAAHDELGDLARSFDQMAERISATQQTLEQRIKARTRELVRAARLADLGTLAAGVAHEINNPLASIASCAEGLERRLRRREVPTTEQVEYLQTIARESYRAHGITKRLLAFARHEPGPAQAVDVLPIAQDLALLLRHQMEQTGVRLQLSLPANLPRVSANADELKQALLNLLVNARDASPQGGVIELRAAALPGAVHLEIRDQGPGIPEEILERIFDPFFTTKPAGKGTGLGLAVACAIVEGFGGQLHAENLPQGGACFRITLPRSEDPTQ